MGDNVFSCRPFAFKGPLKYYGSAAESFIFVFILFETIRRRATFFTFAPAWTQLGDRRRKPNGNKAFASFPLLMI